MTILLTILLYLQLIGPGTYQESQILSLESANQSIVSSIENDPILYGIAEQQCGGQVSQIVVIDDKEEP